MKYFVAPMLRIIGKLLNYAILSILIKIIKNLKLGNEDKYMSFNFNPLVCFSLTAGNILLIICSAVLYGNPFRPIIDLIKEIKSKIWR